MTSGCVSVKHENAHDLIKMHPKGFSDAINASAEAELFVRDCLLTINELEETIERQ
jgi:hypothetical protein